MLTNEFRQPGVMPSTTGFRRVIPTNNNFPSEGLTDLMLFADGAGAAPVNSVTGRAPAVIEAPVALNSAYAWLSGGGVQLDGTQIISLPTSDASTPWTIVSLGAVTGSVGGSASERICGLLGFKEFTVSSRGAGFFVRGGNDWNTPTTTLYYVQRSYNNGTLKAAGNLMPVTGLPVVGNRRARVWSYDGSATLTATTYDKNGTAMATNTYAATDAEMFTVASVTVNTLTPCVGLSSSSYQGGRQEVEAVARYSRVLAAADITKIIAAGVALGAARGRVWA